MFVMVFLWGSVSHDYLVLRIGGVHDTAQLPACVNHNPHHCALRQRQNGKCLRLI